MATVKKKVVVKAESPETEELIIVQTKEEGVKYRYEFNNWDDYNKYIGSKG